MLWDAAKDHAKPQREVRPATHTKLLSCSGMCQRNQKLAAELMRHIASRAPVSPGKVRQGKERALREFGRPERRGAMAVQCGA